MIHRPHLPLLLILLSLECGGLAQGQLFHASSILDSLQSITASTIPSNGDVNPYGVAFVPAGFPAGGKIAPGDLLVANFNNSSNLQGTGTTIVSISPKGQQSVFATSKLIGLDTAIGVLSLGFVIVGNLPVTYPGAVPHQGSLQIFNRSGNLIATLNDANLLDSPWDLTIKDQGSRASVFVSNVLSGTVTRLDLSVSSTQVTVAGKTRIADGYGHEPNAAAVVVGPTGLAYDPDRETLYVASTADNKIFAVADAGDRTSSSGPGYVVFGDQRQLHGPLGLVLAANGNLITANGDAVNPGGTQNELIEFTPQGFLVAEYQIDAGAPGGAFGVASTASQGSIRFAAVDDDLNTVTIWTLRSEF
jgi:sugar lactone lactonase YvrE